MAKKKDDTPAPKPSPEAAAYWDRAREKMRRNKPFANKAKAKAARLAKQQTGGRGRQPRKTAGSGQGG